MTRTTAVFLVSSLLASTASAHPGHGAAEHGLGFLHYLTEPVHAIVALALIATSAAAAIAWRQARTRRGVVRSSR